MQVSCRMYECEYCDKGSCTANEIQISKDGDCDTFINSSGPLDEIDEDLGD